MKNLKFVIYFAALFIMSCENDPGITPSVETFLPKIALKGSSKVVLPCGSTTYADLGVDATENGQPAKVNTTISPRYFGSSTINTADVYDISYVAINVDGIPGAAFRTVTIPPCNGDLVTNIEGSYSSTIFRNGVSAPQYTNVKTIYIKKISGNTYQISDAIGGWYEFGRALGFGYAAPGYKITANNIATNSFTFGPHIEVGGFGGELIMTDFKVDAAKKQIVVTTDWEFGYTFVATLTQI
ncbi:MAG: hypothetical protein WBP08_07255 [Saprospiraceae bacterium]|jgi:hypothetical protein|nr:hypothetical protein [Saprospiraceae bacterium]